MALFNYTAKEITIKIVYYGPGLSGKTTNLQYLHSVLNPKQKGKLVCLPTEADRTLFFDLLPVDYGKIRDFSLRLQLYTVPGQVRYNATRKLVLKGADAVVFVADSQREIREQNIESLKNMRQNLVVNNINADEIPIIMQYNKRDLQNVLSISELNNDLNKNGKYKYIEAIAIDGVGIEDSFHRITKLVINDIKRKQGIPISPVDEEVEAPKIYPDIQKTQVGAGIDDFLNQEFMTTGQMTESTMYESHEPTELEQTAYEIPDPGEELAHIEIEEEPPIQKDTPRGVEETSRIEAVRLDMIVEYLRESLSILREINDMTKKLVEERMEISEQLRDLKKKFESEKTKKGETKKGWFRFS